MKDEIVLFSHGDVDGICSAAIVGRTLNKLYGWDKDPIFCEPHNYTSFLKRFAKQRNIIVDVYVKMPEIPIKHTYRIDDYYGFRYTLVNGIIPFLMVIDHHPNRAPSNTLLLKDYLGATDYLVNLGLAGDVKKVLIRDDKIVKDAKILRGAISYKVDDSAFRLFVYRQLFRGKKVGEIEEVKVRYKQFREYFESLVSDYDNHIFYEDDLFLVLNWEIGRGYVGVLAGRLAHDSGKNVFIVRKVDDVTVMTYRGKLGMLWIGEVLKDRDPNYVGHGGHQRAFSYTTKSTQKDVLGMLIEFLKDRYGNRR